MKATVIIKGNSTKDKIKLADRVTKEHTKGNVITGQIGKYFIEFCKNTIIIM